MSTADVSATSFHCEGEIHSLKRQVFDLWEQTSVIGRLDRLRGEAMYRQRLGASSPVLRDGNEGLRILAWEQSELRDLPKYIRS